MKLKFLTLIAIAFSFNTLLLAQTNNKPSKKWLEQRYSMFIHWGLYSELGGVWDNKPVEWGYSEQIQSFAGIFGDYYAATAKRFKAEKWNADSIAILAKEAGMKSIVFTSKHHDGFSMYNTKYSAYNIVKETPFGRDPLMELSKACAKQGLSFGIYYSLIDWNYPHAYPISSTNADPVTPEHHQYSMNQVRELLTNYGPISEIWFDMGSLTREQSRELYNLVTTLQPTCMVSGRLGNDFGDFAVMADNACPNYYIGIPWQTAGSIFKETWSYRSWQKRDNLSEKIAEKQATLNEVIKNGGNYLLNIGPRGDGSVVDFETQVIKALKVPTDIENNKSSITPDKSAVAPDKSTGTSKVAITPGAELNFLNATKIYGYSSFDYYSSFKSIIGYEWNFIGKKKSTPYIIYNAGDANKELVINHNNSAYTVKLEGGEAIAQKENTLPNNIKLSYTFVLKEGRQSFGEAFLDKGALSVINSLESSSNFKVAEDKGWKLIASSSNNNVPNINFSYSSPIKWKQNLWFAHIINSGDNSNILAKFGEGSDALEIWLNGVQLFKKGYTNILPSKEYITLNLTKGENILLVKRHNRFNEEISHSITTDVPQTWYKLPLPFAIAKKENTISLKLKSQRGGADIGSRELKITL